MKNLTKLLVIIALATVIGFSFTACDDDNNDTHTHTWGEWVTTPATVTDNGVDTITCTVCGAVKETKFSGEYAIGTAGLEFALIDIEGGTDNAYRVSKGTFVGAALVIPAYHRPDASSQYLPVTSISTGTTDWIGSNAFGGTYSGTIIPNTTLASVTFTEGSQLKTIGDFAFVFCSSLTSITIPNSVTSIGSNTFQGTGFTSVTIPASVTSIGNHAFVQCSNLASITVDAQNQQYASESGILYDKAKTTLIQCPPTKNSMTIPASVTTIGGGAFDGTDLTSITIPNNVTSIGYSAFSDCTSLTSITIPASVTTMGLAVFGGWTNTQIINVPFANVNAKPEGWDTDWNKQQTNGTYVDIAAIIKYWNGTTWE